MIVTHLNKAGGFYRVRGTRLLCPDGVIRGVVKIKMVRDAEGNLACAVQIRKKYVGGKVVRRDDQYCFEPLPSYLRYLKECAKEC